jgi:flagellar motility protein MotE (MotC chaperone)
MKKVILGLGIIAAAELIFVGLVYGLLAAQGRMNAETLNRLHELPVVGGFFPKKEVKRPDPTPDEIREKRVRAAIAEAGESFRLPPPYTKEEIESLERDLKDAKSRYEKKAEEIERRELERGTLENELKARREAIDEDQAKLDKKLEELKALKDEIARERAIATETARVDQEQNFRMIAGIYEKMGATEAAAKLAEIEDDACARILAAMEPRSAGKILGSFEMTKAVTITKKLQTFAKAVSTKAAPSE